MDEILIYTGIYGILFLSVINIAVVVVAYRKNILAFSDSLMFVMGILGMALLASSVFFRNITKMHWMYYAAILACLVGLIGLLLNLTKQLIRKP